MNIRLKSYLISIPQFIGFSLISTFLCLFLFHIAIIGFPVLAFMWTFWGFSIFTVITGVKLKTKHVLIFAVLNLFFTSSLLGLVFVNIESFKFNLPTTIVLCITVVIIAFYIFVLVKLFKIYWPSVKEEFILLFKKKEPKTTDIES